MRFEARAPFPTPAPAAELVAHRLEKRQFDILNELCGFESGNFASPLLCQTPYVCATDSNINARGCCTAPLDQCFLKSACVQSTDLSVSCGSLCSSNQNVAKCSFSTAPYCYTKFYSVDFGPTQSEIGCTSVSGVTVDAYLSYTFTSGPISFTFSSASVAATGLDGVSATAPTRSTPSETSSSSGSAASASSTIASSSSNDVSDSHSSGGGGLSQGAIIGIAVCATVVGLAILGLIFFFFWRKRKHATPTQQYHNPNVPPPMLQTQQPPPDVAGAFPHSGDAFHPNNFDSFNANFSQMDDDAVAKLRRFSNDGTIEQTVAGRTNDEFRPQAA